MVDLGQIPPAVVPLVDQLRQRLEAPADDVPAPATTAVTPEG